MSCISQHAHFTTYANSKGDVVARLHHISLQELEQGVPMAQRVRAMKELHEIVATKRLEEVGSKHDCNLNSSDSSPHALACSAGHLAGHQGPGGPLTASGSQARRTGLYQGPHLRPGGQVIMDSNLPDSVQPISAVPPFSLRTWVCSGPTSSVWFRAMQSRRILRIGER